MSGEDGRLTTDDQTFGLIAHPGLKATPRLQRGRLSKEGRNPSPDYRLRSFEFINLTRPLHRRGDVE